MEPVKDLYRLHDNKLIESTLMPYRDGRRTACISSQPGCAMGCKFCATGQMGFARHLSAEEIFEQAQRFSQELQQKGERLSNIVLMGMGEPFHNYNAVIEAIHLLKDRLGIGARKKLYPTVGLAPKSSVCPRRTPSQHCHLSLHSTLDEERTAIMPINRKYPIEELISACREFVEATNRRITFEYALINGQNDTPEEATRLRMAAGTDVPCECNPTQSCICKNSTMALPSDPVRVQAFIDILERGGIQRRFAFVH